MLRPPPISTRTDTLFPYSTLFRSHRDQQRHLRRIAVVVYAADPAGLGAAEAPERLEHGDQCWKGRIVQHAQYLGDAEQGNQPPAAQFAAPRRFLRCRPLLRLRGRLSRGSSALRDVSGGPLPRPRPPSRLLPTTPCLSRR